MLNTSHNEFHRQSLSPSWPLKFFGARYFDRTAENQPYIEWLRNYVDKGWDSVNSSNNEEDEDDGEYKEVETSGGVQEREDIENEGFDFLTKGFDLFSGDSQDNAPEEMYRDPSNSGELERYGKESIPRVFMKGMTGDEQCLPYRDQVDVVVGFCEKALANTVGTKGSGPEKSRIILLEDTTHSGGIAKTDEQRRTFRGQYTPNQLREKLGRPRFIVKSKQINSVDSERIDIERRILFLPDLDPSTIEAIFATAPRNHALALKNFFYEYLTGKASIRVKIPRLGFKFFTFTLHIPFYVLKESEKLLEDTRKGNDGKSLRRSWRLPFLSGHKGALSLPGYQCLYEAQISVTITGTDHRTWTAYGAFDTYYGSNDSVDAYYQMRTPTSLADPLTAGKISRRNIIWTPREYYFKVFEIRINQVLREWRAIFDGIENEIDPYRRNFETSPAIDHQPIDYSWGREATVFLRKLITLLGDTVEAWIRFQRRDILYFLFDDGLPTNSLLLKDSVHAVENVFLDLNDILRKLRGLERGLCEDISHGRNALVSLQPQQDGLQQKASNHVRVITVLSVVYFPLALAAALFSTSGVLPFPHNIKNFMFVLIVLAILVLFTVSATLFKWQQWIRNLANYMPIRGSSRITRRWDVEYGVEHRVGDGDEQLSTPAGPTFKSPCFEFNPWSIFGSLKGSVYSPLNTRDSTHQDIGEQYYSHTALLQNPQSVTFDRTQISSAKPHFAQRLTQRSLCRLFAIINNKLKRLLRPLPDAEKQRIQWICKCGHELYADLSSRAPEETARLTSILQYASYPTTPIHGSYSMNSLASGHSPSQTNFENITPAISSPQNLPGSGPATLLDSASRGRSTATGSSQDQDYLELCINTSQYTKTLCEIGLRDIRSDSELFLRIRSEYFRLRKSRSNLWLLRPSGIHFVKFTLQDSLRVGILQKPLSIPPPEEVFAKRYAYSPCPLEDDPPMPSDIFLHYLNCTALDSSSAWLPRLPKKSDPSIFHFLGPLNEGWGIHITEGPNWFVIGLANLFMIGMSGLAAGLWKLYMDDFQGAFGFAGWIIGVVNAILLVYIAKWNRT